MMRIQKFLSISGVCSRRTAEEWLKAGRIAINGEKVITPGVQVDPEKDVVTVDGREVIQSEKKIYLAYHKPIGVTSTLEDPFAETTVPDEVQSDIRLNIAGRLDRETSGLMLLSNDGDFILKVTHPSFRSEKEYIGITNKRIHPELFFALLGGCEIDGVYYHPCRGELLGDKQFRIILEEGKKRQIRYMLQSIGTRVKTLQRIRIGIVQLADLKVGEVRNLTDREINYFLQLKKS
jgi:pseudouridine synthase